MTRPGRSGRLSSMSDGYPTVDESRDRLHRAGWSLGESAFGPTWQVDGSNGENRLLATGASQEEAWWRACCQSRHGVAGSPPNHVTRWR
jgi:hypothetical protein